MEQHGGGHGGELRGASAISGRPVAARAAGGLAAVLTMRSACQGP